MRYGILISLLAVASVGHDALAQKTESAVSAEVAEAESPKPQSLAQFVFDTIDQVGLQEGLAVLEKYQKSDLFYFRERNFYKTAHVLYERNQIEQSLAVFEVLEKQFPTLKQSLACQLFLVAHHEGAEKAELWLADRRDDDNFYLEQYELELGQAAFTQRQKLSEAKLFAKLYVQEFPDSPDAHELMANIHLAEGNKALARQEFAHSVALSEKTTFFTLAMQEPTTYQPTVVPRDATKLFQAEGNEESATVFIFVQGGPDPALGVYREDPLTLLPNQDDILRVHVLESQILNRNLLCSKPVLTEEQSLFEHNQSAEMLHRTVAHFKQQGKQVFVIGHSYGCLIGIDYLYTKPNLADRIVLMGSDFDEDLRNYDESLKGQGKLVRWIDGVEPYAKSFWGDFTMLPLIAEDLNRIFTNTDLLVSAHGKRRFTQLLAGKDLSNVIFLHGRFDESNGRTKPHELEFLHKHGAKTVETYGDHHSMLSSAVMVNLYQHLLHDKPLKKSLAAELSDAIDEDGLESALVQFERNRKSDQFHPVVEDELNKLGYSLIAAEKLVEAVAVMAINAEAFPQSWNAHDSLGEAYLAAGQRGPARESYERSVELHPGNRFGLTALERLAKNSVSAQP